MERFSDDVTIAKFQALNNTQNSIQSTSSWVIAHKNDAKEVVKIWYKEFRKAPTKKKLTFLNLANDIIQNGRKRAPQFLTIYQAVLPVAFKETAKSADKKTRESLTRLLKIWRERNIYKKDFLEKVKSSMNKAIEKELKASNPIIIEQIIPEPMEVLESHSVSHRDPRIKANKLMKVTSEEPESSKVFIEIVREEKEIDTENDKIMTSTCKELLKSLEDIQNPPSIDEVTRRTIASFSTEVSDPQAVHIVKYRPEAFALLEKVKNADKMLLEYNHRLEVEMGQRKNLGPQIRSWLDNQSEVVAKLKTKLQLNRNKLEKAKSIRESINSHLCNLPELSLNTKSNDSLNPLPSLDELFN